MRDALKWTLLAIVSTAGWCVGLIAVPFHVAYRLCSKRYHINYYMRQIAVGNDVMAGSMIYGSKHTISAITGYRAYMGGWWHKTQEHVIDFFFGSGHCRREAVDEGLIKTKGETK